MRHEFLTETPRSKHSTPQTQWFSGLSDRAKAAMARAAKSRTVLEPPTEAEMLALYRKARAGLALADEMPARRMIHKNPDIVRIIRKEPGGPALGLYAFLPLNDFGASMLARGLFDGTEPDPAWICRSGERPVAIYEWLFFGPSLYFRTLAAMAEQFAAICPDGCAFFSRGSTEVSAKLLVKLGFLDASQLYPEAKPGMVVLVPQGVPRLPDRQAGRNTEVRQVRDFEGLAHVFSIRSATYIAEQFPLYAEEFDGNDFCSTHFVGYIDGEPAGSVRVRYFGDFAKIERLAVKLEYRTSRLAFTLVKTAVRHAREKGFTRLYGHASEKMVPFWRTFGGRVLDDRAPFRFASITYREMVAEFEPLAMAIKFGAAPMVTIRPEGRWDEPAPLDWSNVISDPKREALLAQHLRRP